MDFFRLTLACFREMNPLLLESVYRLKQTDRGARKTCVGGWHSTDPGIVLMPGFDRLVDILHTYGNVLELWANVHPRGGYNYRHHHGFEKKSGVYYVKVPSPVAAIVFHRGEESFRVEPAEGDLLLFDSSLEHSVEPNPSDEDRVSIAFNFRD